MRASPEGKTERTMPVEDLSTIDRTRLPHQPRVTCWRRFASIDASLSSSAVRVFFAPESPLRSAKRAHGSSSSDVTMPRRTPFWRCFVAKGPMPASSPLMSRIVTRFDRSSRQSSPRTDTSTCL